MLELASENLISIYLKTIIKKLNQYLKTRLHKKNLLDTIKLTKYLIQNLTFTSKA